MKSGEFLLKYFAADGTEQFPFPAVVEAMVDVDRTIHAAAAAGDEDAKDALEYVNSLWAAIVTSANRSSISDFSSLTPIDAAMRLALRMADRLTSVPDANGEQEQRDRLLDLVDSIPTLLADLDVPRELKEYVLQLSNELRYTLDHFEATGGFCIQAAFARLQASLSTLFTAVGNEKDTKKALTFVKEKLVPCITAVTLLLNVPGAALGTVTSIHDLIVGKPFSSIESGTRQDGGDPVEADR